MNNISSGSLPLFRVAGIQVYLHWSWLVVGYFAIVNRVNRYESIAWNILEYLALFGIVLLHEFGHALACRQVGGQANRIMLWPLGGVAFVDPPPRPGATLWSIAAGPLVNVVLAPITIGAWFFAMAFGLQDVNPDLMHFLVSLASINIGLLVFNMLPIYPLDGGQILRCLLWFVLGPGRSLMVSGILGIAGAAGLVILAFGYFDDRWLAVVAAFVAWQAWLGFRLGGKLHSMQATIDVMNDGMVAFQTGRFDDAVKHFSKVIDAGGDPGVLATAHTNRGLSEIRLGGWERAIQDFKEAIRLQPTLATAHNNLAWVLAVCPVDALRNGQEAVEHATLACKSTGWSNANCVATFAAASAEVGDFVQAVKWQKYALGDSAYRKRNGEQKVIDRLHLYEEGLPFRLPMNGG
jgi:Zn-dependent protease